MRKTFPKILLGLLVLFIGIQLIRPEQSNPTSDPALSIAAVASPDARITGILQRSCYDCHSNESRWPWYSQIAPVSWTVAHDVEEGREHLNFSTWGSYSNEDKLHLLDELCEEIEKGKMPMGNYLMMHPEADLTEEEQMILCQWTVRERTRLGGAADSDGSKGRDR